MSTNFISEKLLGKQVDVHFLTDYNSLNWLMSIRIFHLLFIFIKLIISNPGILIFGNNVISSIILNEQDDKLKNRINEKYKHFIEIKENEEKYEKDNRNSSNISSHDLDNQNTTFQLPKLDKESLLLYKYGYLSQIENDSSNSFVYCNECKMFKLPRMEHCKEANQ